MKKNNRGFMLAEVIVTSTVIVTAMIGLYTSFNKLYKNYEVKNRYQYIDGVYATKEMVQGMLNDDMAHFMNDIFYSSTSKYLIQNNQCDESTLVSSCQDIANFYHVLNMIIVEYDEESIKSLIKPPNVISEEFKEYIEYVINYYDVKRGDAEYSYLLLTEIQDGDHYYYANLRVR